MTEDSAERLAEVREDARNLLAIGADLRRGRAEGALRLDLLSTEEREVYYDILSVNEEASCLLENYETMPLCDLEIALTRARCVFRAVADETRLIAGAISEIRALLAALDAASKCPDGGAAA